MAGCAQGALPLAWWGQGHLEHNSPSSWSVQPLCRSAPLMCLLYSGLAQSAVSIKRSSTKRGPWQLSLGNDTHCTHNLRDQCHISKLKKQRGSGSKEPCFVVRFNWDFPFSLTTKYLKFKKKRISPNVTGRAVWSHYIFSLFVDLCLYHRTVNPPEGRDSSHSTYSNPTATCPGFHT